MDARFWSAIARQGLLAGLGAIAAIGLEGSATAQENTAQITTRRRTPMELVSEGERMVMRGEVVLAVNAYREAESMNTYFEIGAQSWNLLCWYGSLWNEAERVLAACERAVALEPDNVEIRDSRGLARALLGDFQGAIDDFEAFVEETEDEGRRFQRQNWIEMLEVGENPFTPEVLRMLFVD